MMPPKTPLERELEMYREEEAIKLKELDSSRVLFAEVIALAAADLFYLESRASAKKLTAGEKRRLRNIFNDGGHPREFFEGQWFEDICGLLSVDPDRTRRLILNSRSG